MRYRAPGRLVLAGALAGAVLLVAADIGSYWWEAEYYFRGYGLAVSRGEIAVIWWVAADPALSSMPVGGRFVPRETESNWLHHWTSAPGIDGAQLPLWPLVLPLGGLGAFSWYRSSVLPNGCCRCGYDLKGNQTGICPECGRRISRKVTEHKL